MEEKMTTYYVYEEPDRKITNAKLILQTTSKKKAMKACDESQAPVRVTKFIKWNYMTPVVHCNQVWAEKYLNTIKWAEGFIALGEW